jgi:hypothetical protein
MIVLVHDCDGLLRSPPARVGQHRCYYESRRPAQAVASRKTNIPRQGPLRPCPGFEPSFSSFSNALLHFLQGNESGLSSVDLPLPLVENLLMPIRHRHLIFVLRKRSPNSLHCSQLFLYRHLIQRQHSIHKPNHPITPCIAQSFSSTCFLH